MRYPLDSAIYPPNNRGQIHGEYNNSCKKIHLRKKRLESKLRRKYGLNLLNEPQNFAEIKIPKLLKILNAGVTNLRERREKLFLKIEKPKRFSSQAVNFF